MATRGLVDASIDAFWNSAGSARPATPPELRRSQPHRRTGGPRASSLKSARGYAASGGGPHSARRGAPAAEQDLPSEFQHVTVELSGREGYNAVAVNGIWRFWRVRAGRLAFRRDAGLQVEPDNLEEEGCSSEDSGGATSDANAAAGRTGNGQSGTETIRLFLFYAPQVDAWLISDSANLSGSISADCGPVGDDEDLGNHWRVWDGEKWRQDRNIVAEVSYGSSSISNLNGLRVVKPKQERQRAASQEPSSMLPSLLPKVPDCEKPQDSARRPRRG